MVSFPHCKINLGLNILRKRQDGFHDIETCFFPIPFTDILEVIPAEDFSFSLSGNIIPGKEQDNICVKAYDLLKQKLLITPVKIHLHKIVPAGAGLGGGSSDGAYTLRLLNEVLNLAQSKNELAQFAAMLGSDCSFFVYDTPMLGSGRGELLTPAIISLKGLYFVLINPGIHVSTIAAYSGVVPSPSELSIAEILNLPINEWRGVLKNNFEQSVFKNYPEIQNIKNELYNSGALYASMSGSGSSVYGIFRNETEIPNDLKENILWQGVLS